MCEHFDPQALAKDIKDSLANGARREAQRAEKAAAAYPRWYAHACSAQALMLFLLSRCATSLLLS